MLCSVVGAVNVSTHKLLRFRGGVRRKVRRARCLSEKFKGNLKVVLVSLNVTPELPPLPPP